MGGEQSCLACPGPLASGSPTHPRPAVLQTLLARARLWTLVEAEASLPRDATASLLSDHHLPRDTAYI